VLGLDEGEGPGNDEEAAHDWIWIRFNGGEWNKFQWSSPDRQFFRHLKQLDVRISKESMQVYKAPVPLPHKGHERASALARVINLSKNESVRTSIYRPDTNEKNTPSQYACSNSSCRYTSPLRFLELDVRQLQPARFSC
jgi:hypothetical protein